MALINIIMMILVGILLLIVAIPLSIMRSMRRFGSGSAPGRRRGRKEGEVSVSGQNASDEDKIVGDNIGEYVDYEEVKDENIR